MEINDPLKDMSPGDRLSDFFADYSMVLALAGAMIYIICEAVSTGSIGAIIIGGIFVIPFLLLILGIIHSRSRNHGDIE